MVRNNKAGYVTYYFVLAIFLLGFLSTNAIMTIRGTNENRVETKHNININTNTVRYDISSETEFAHETTLPRTENKENFETQTTSGFTANKTKTETESEIKTQPEAKKEPVNIVTSDPKEGDVIGCINSPRLGINCLLVYGTTQACLEKGAGIHKTSTFEKSDRALCPIFAAHCATYFKGFKALDPAKYELPSNVLIHVRAYDKQYTYRVTRVEVMNKDQFQFPYDSYYESAPDTAIFYTCYPFEETNYIKQDRMFIYCELVK